ncbi:substrate-binding periplasmic protein [Thalassomonas actiniarum]|uniref:substrate-binding periplasmic protein n=1 Tax=Thalassomonas actiniarum TaxID=485447 RepID=UPI00236125E0|nr:transporter substrate-binding domain-containing protein [Thalassomonas actiniarum]
MRFYMVVRGFIRLIAFSFMFFGAKLTAAPLVFVLPHFPPFAYLDQGIVRGIAVDKVVPVLEALELDYQLTLVPNYGRALEEVKQGRAVGFFLASENAQRNKVARFSQPVMLNNWSWFYRADLKEIATPAPDFSAGVTIGTIPHTNTGYWLKKHNYQYQVDGIDNLLKLTFEQQWLDAIFVAEKVFLTAAKKHGLENSRYRQTIALSKPFGIYISKAFLASSPGFLSRLNRQIAKQTGVQGPLP